MISIFGKNVIAARPELPADPELARLTFLARHFEDLQSIRYLGIYLLLMETPLLDCLPQRSALLVATGTAICGVLCFFGWRRWTAEHYGRIQSAGDDDTYPFEWIFPAALLFQALMALADAIGTGKSSTAVHILGAGFVANQWNMRRADRTNLPIRRTVYKAVAVGVVGNVLLVLFARHNSFWLDCNALLGTLFLAASMFDAWLLAWCFRRLKEHA